MIFEPLVYWYYYANFYSKRNFTDVIKDNIQLSLSPRDYLGGPNLIIHALSEQSFLNGYSRECLRCSDKEKDLDDQASILLRWRRPQDKDLGVASRRWEPSSADRQLENKNIALKSRKMNFANNRKVIGKGSWTSGEHATLF